MLLKEWGSELLRLQEQCEVHESFLKELVRGGYAYLRSYLSGNLSFGIARRWNSWYPSYFDVEGGCYVLIPGDMNAHNMENKIDTRIGVIVIDPGFKFVEILRSDYLIEPRDISTVIVTHFHPDHMAGLLEYATIMNTSKQPCNIYLNETTYAAFRSIQNSFITVTELLDGQIQEIMRYATRDKKYVRVTIKAVSVHHNEIGNQHRSLGLILETTRSNSKDFASDSRQRYRIGILGDTDGNQEYIPFYVRNFQEVDILILHLGTFSNKKLGRGGQHLYIEGVSRILRQMGNKLEETGNGKKIVVLSEFGLELADQDSLYRKLQPFIVSHSWRLPLIFTGLYLKRENKTLEGDQGGSLFFARATLELLEKVYKSSHNEISASHQILTKKDIDGLLVALTLQVLAFSNSDLREVLREFRHKLVKFIDREKKTRLLDRLRPEQYMDYLEKQNLMAEGALKALRLFYEHLVQKADFAQVPLKTHPLIQSCELLIGRIGQNLEYVDSGLYYIDKLEYISKYAESRGVKEYVWAFGKGSAIKDLSLFWTACLTGVFLLREVLKTTLAKTRPFEENNLLQIGDYFRKDLESWANLLVGDIGCIFGLDPFASGNTQERSRGIWLKSTKGDWISPYCAECFYDRENDRISYRHPEK